MEIYNSPIPSSLRRYLRYARLGINELPTFYKTPRKVNIAGYEINCHSTRMKLLFVHRELTCKCCGIKASFAAIESCPASKGHKGINFYGYDYDGNEVLLTWDHMIPKSIGGKNNMKNSQTLCTICNVIKGNNLHFREIRKVREMRGLPIQYEYGENETIYWWNSKTYSTIYKEKRRKQD